MSKLVEHIINKDYRSAELSLEESFQDIMERKLLEVKKRVAASMCSEGEDKEEELDEERSRVADEEARESYSTTRGKITKLKDGTYHAVSLSGNIKQFKSEASAKKHASKKDLDEEDVKEVRSPHDIRMDRLKKDVLEEDDEDLSEARINIVRARIRGGKIQRRKRVSNVPGMTLRGGKLTRMSPSERRKRKLGARKAARKSRAKKSQMLRKRKLSLMKRARLGV